MARRDAAGRTLARACARLQRRALGEGEQLGHEGREEHLASNLDNLAHRLLLHAVPVHLGLPPVGHESTNLIPRGCERGGDRD